MKRIIMVSAIIAAGMFFSSGSPILAQDFCEGNFDYDEDVDGTDAFQFKTDFGRSKILNPCPPDGPAPVPRTGQTLCYEFNGVSWVLIDCEGTGYDGEFQKGVEWPSPRFTDNGDDTVTDNLTGLIWLQNSNCMGVTYSGYDNDGIAGDGLVTWQHSLDFIAGINDGTYCDCGGLSSLNDWRLPNIRELHSLVDYGYVYPAVSTDHLFVNLQSYCYWSSTAMELSNNAWPVWFDIGDIRLMSETNDCYVWPVRGGH